MKNHQKTTKERHKRLGSRKKNVEITIKNISPNTTAGKREIINETF